MSELKEALLEFKKEMEDKIIGKEPNRELIKLSVDMELKDMSAIGWRFILNLRGPCIAWKRKALELIINSGIRSQMESFTEAYLKVGKEKGLFQNVNISDIIKPKCNDATTELLKALKEISEGKGAYSRDQLEHAGNCIRDMKEIAVKAIAKVEGKK